MKNGKSRLCKLVVYYLCSTCEVESARLISPGVFPSVPNKKCIVITTTIINALIVLYEVAIFLVL